MSSLDMMIDLQLQANYINWIGMMFIRCYCYLIVPLGLIGHLFNVYIFTRPSLRSNPCVMYFLAATIFGLLVTCFILPMRLIQSAYIGTDPGAYSSIICKVIWFLLNSIRASSFWLIVLACADRYFCSSTSTNKRAWSSIRVAIRSIPFTILLCFIAYIHVPIFFKIDIISATNKPVCYPSGPPGTYRLFLSYFNLIFFGLAPSLSMCAFAMLMLRNIKKSKLLRVLPLTSVNNVVNKNRHKTDRQMVRMLLIQILVYSVTGITFSIAWIILATSSTQAKNSVQVAKENLINAVVGMCSNTGPCLSFYLFTLSSKLFRKELNNLFNRCIKKNNQLNNDSTSTRDADRGRATVITKHHLTLESIV
ncbi:hypothetical protein I4U23_011268 [Adineta vaga]|nr:hypothetical protein I4U23_011268 [Adineta vaga]